MRWTLDTYIARRFLLTAVAVFATVFALIAVVNFIELLRANDAGKAGFFQIAAMAMLRTPAVSISAAPFTVLLAAMACFAGMARASELVVTRAAGLSIWRLIAPALVVAAGMGCVAFAIYNPVSAAFASRVATLEEKHFGRSSSSLSVASGGIWLRQGAETGHTVIRAERASQGIDQLWSVSIFRFGEDDRFETRIEAGRVVLEPGHWRLHDTHSWRLGGTGGMADEMIAEYRETMTLPTRLTPEQIEESFAPPRTISFWNLPGFIDLLEESGFSSRRHRLYWHSLLAAPGVYVAMVLFGAAFSTRHVRFGGLGAMAVGCVLTGFAYFFLSDVAQALGASGAVPVMLAAWGPPAAATLLALGLLLHVEDG